MEKIDEVYDELISREYLVEKTTKVIEGKEVAAVAMGRTGEAVQTYEVTEGWDTLSVDEICDGLEAIYNQDSISVKALELVQDPDYVHENVILCIRPQMEENIVKKDYLDLEIYPYVTFDDKYGSVITPKLAETVEDTLEYAIANSEGTFIYHELDDFAPSGIEGSTGGVIITTISQLQGASALYYPKEFEYVCKERGWNECYIIPSSIHEVLAVDTEGIDEDDMNEFLKKQNRVLNEGQILSDHIYKYSLETGEITY